MAQFPSQSSASGLWSLKKQKRAEQGDNWPLLYGPVDDYFEYVTMLLPGNGTNGAQNNTFLDSSTNNFTITRNGNTTQGTFTPYGSNWSNYFDGSGDFLATPSNVAFVLGSSGDFTIECWIYPIGTQTQYATVVSTYTDYNTGSGYNNKWHLGYSTATTLTWYTSGGNSGIDSTNHPVNSWSHVAVVRSGSTITMYVNGVSVGTQTTAQSYTSQSPVQIGFVTNAAYFNGYISNVRVVKGTAVYTSNFTSPTAPLTAITNTSLLTCADNRFIDDSTNNFTITANGNTSVQRFSPFSPTAPYAAEAVGGSGYFDGSGDYLQAGTNSNLALGSGNFTIDGWHYCIGYNGGGTLYSTINTYPSSTGLLFYIDSIGRYTIDVNGTILQPAGTAALNTWVHWAVVRNGSTLSIYINGTSVGSVSSSTNFTDQYAVIGRTGAGTNSNLFLGYLSNTRMVKGTAVYTANFTPPTVPVTAIANTQFLCDFTNGGIIDNAMMNDLETVGNAQISTSVSKFGGGSMAFDGTGDYLVSNAATTDSYAFGTGDFTVEFWLYLNSASGVIILFDPRNSSETNCPVVYMSSGVLYFYVNSVNRITGATLSTSTWYHIALSRSGSSTKLFVNGTQSGSTYTDTNNYVCQSNRPIIGANGYVSGGGVGIYALNGYIDDLRVTKGYARYTGNFTAPTAPFPTY